MPPFILANYFIKSWVVEMNEFRIGSLPGGIIFVRPISDKVVDQCITKPQIGLTTYGFRWACRESSVETERSKIGCISMRRPSLECWQSLTRTEKHLSITSVVAQRCRVVNPLEMNAVTLPMEWRHVRFFEFKLPTARVVWVTLVF